VALFRPLVLVYHAVSDGWNDPLSVRVADFDRQMRKLVARGYRGATWRDLLSDPGNGKLVHITFDDAFRSVGNALPVLRELGLPSTIFPCSRYANDGGRLNIPQLSHRSDDDEISTMDWTALRAIAEDGLVEIGSHGCGHVDLVQLSDAELRAELGDSKSEIEDHLGRSCATLAYPFGRQDARVRRAAATAGYAAAFGAPGVSDQVDPFRIPRTGIWRDEPPLRQAVRTRFLIRLVLERRGGKLP
jgi:peptidoglycan/xylan/chitin deacetylase (PgdA/CDA1 family)